MFYVLTTSEMSKLDNWKKWNVLTEQATTHPRKDNEYENRVKDVLNEGENLDELEETYNESLLTLREKFPSIPEDLTKKFVNIDVQVDWRPINLIIDADGLAISFSEGITGICIFISKHRGIYRVWTVIEKKSVCSKFKYRLDKIISNADNAKIHIGP